MQELRMGRVRVDRAEALEFAAGYLSGVVGWAYPSYDSFDAGNATGPLVDGDLLAPLLLNARISIKTYEALQVARPRLQELLDPLPSDVSLADAGPGTLDQIDALFSVLKRPGIRGVRSAVLSKLLHRKRPALIPLYDSNVEQVYPSEDTPTWRGFAGAVQTDLRRELPFWQQVAALARGPAITPLRALDIVVWRAGGCTRTGGTTATPGSAS